MKAYMIVRKDETPIFKETKVAVKAWIKLNPGEMLYWEEVNPLDLLNEKVVVEPAALKQAIENFATASVELSWLGSKDAESHAEIEREHREALDSLKELTGLELS